MTARNRGKLFLGLCLAGFLPGIIYANTGSREYILSMEILSDAFLEQYADAERTGGFLLYILAVRVSLLGGLVLLGQARRLRRFAAGAVLLWTGFLGGLFITAALIRLGPAGILFCMAALLPQAFFLRRRIRDHPVVLLFLPGGKMEFCQDGGRCRGTRDGHFM